MAYMMLHLETRDFDAWKQRFDSDPAGRKDTAKSHRVVRSVDNPDEVFVRVEFASVEDAKAFRERLLASGALDNPVATVKSGPTVTEVVETVTY